MMWCICDNIMKLWIYSIIWFSNITTDSYICLSRTGSQLHCCSYHSSTALPKEKNRLRVLQDCALSCVYVISEDGWLCWIFKTNTNKFCCIHLPTVNYITITGTILLPYTWKNCLFNIPQLTQNICEGQHFIKWRKTINLKYNNATNSSHFHN